MIQNVLSQIGGIGVYGVIAICLFFFAFSLMVVRAFLLKKPYLDAMRELPLQDDAPVSLTQGEKRHEHE